MLLQVIMKLLKASGKLLIGLEACTNHFALGSARRWLQGARTGAGWRGHYGGGGSAR